MGTWNAPSLARQYPFPTEVYARIDACLSVNSSESKQATLLNFGPGYSTGNDISKNLDLGLNKFAWRPSAPTLRTYCSSSFVPRGIASERTRISKRSKNGYAMEWKLTPAGEKYAVPMAAFFMDYAINSGISLHQVLGSISTNSKDRDGPITRFKILEELSKLDDPISEAELLGLIGNGNTTGVMYHLQNLSEIDFVDFYSVLYEKARVKYRTTGKERVDVSEGSSCSERSVLNILSLIDSNKEASISDVSEEVSLAHDTVRRIFSYLKVSGYIEPIRWDGVEKMSEVEITNKGRDFFNEKFLPVKEVLSGDEKKLKKMRSFVGTFDNDDYSTALRIYSEVSNILNSKNIDESLSLVEIMMRKKSPVTHLDVANAFGVGRDTAGKYLRLMMEKEIVVRDGSVMPYKYSLAK